MTARIKLLNAKIKTHNSKRAHNFNHYSGVSDFGSLDPVGAVVAAADRIASSVAVCYSGQMAVNIVD